MHTGYDNRNATIYNFHPSVTGIFMLEMKRIVLRTILTCLTKRPDLYFLDGRTDVQT